jgi:protein SCO1/2
MKLLTALIVLFALAGCNKSVRHDLRGQVLEVHAESAEIVTKHEAIPGFMPAMTMPYLVKDTVNFPKLKPGDLFTAEVVQSGSDKYWLENVSITGFADLVQATPPEPVKIIKVGDPFPDVAFTNQDAKTVRISELRGKAVLLTFIYTRCPMPNFCPRLSSAFSKLYDKVKTRPADLPRTHFISVSMDPKYDSAPVLRKYGLAYLANNPAGFANWDFVFSDPNGLRTLAGALDLEYEEQSGQIGHTMVIALIGKDGKLAKDWGSQWNIEELEAALMSEASK